MSVAAILEQAAARRPQAAALVDDAAARTWTFAQFAAACAGVGARLAHAGLSRGAHVALLADAQPEYLFADYGAMAAGFVRVPLDPSLTSAELGAQVVDAEARVILAGASRRELAEALGRACGVPVLALEALAAEAPPAWPACAPEAVASLNYTGGTSSAPKAVMHTHASLAAVVDNVARARGTAPGEVMLNVRPLWPIAAVIVLAHLAAGGTVVLGGAFDPARMVALLRRHRAASTSLVPTLLVRLLRDVPAAKLASLEALRAIDVGGAAIAPETFAAAVDALGPKIGVLYGLTESPWSCYQRPADLVGADGRIEPARFRTAGRPVARCELRIDAESGEVLVRGPHVMRGYWKRTALTAEALREGWFHTGDQGALEADGRLRITGRLKETIRSGGKSVQPEEVEGVLCGHPKVAEAAVVGLPDAEWGEVVAAAVVAAPGVALTIEELAAHCRAALSAHKRPKLIRVVDALPRSHYGKVLRAKVKAALTGA